MPWTVDRLKAARDAYRAEHDGPRFDPEARNLRHTHVSVSDDQRTWRVQQVLVDAEEDNAWVAEFSVDLPGSRAADRPVLSLRALREVG